MTKTISTAVAISLLALAAQAAEPGTSRGQALFESQCQRCHRAGAKSLNVDPDQLKQTFMAVRQHRTAPNETDMAALADYLRQVR